MLQNHTKLSKIAQRLAKLPKTAKPTTFIQFYDLLPHCEREQFKEDMKYAMGWTNSQWNNRFYGRTKFVKTEILVLEILSGQEHKL